MKKFVGKYSAPFNYVYGKYEFRFNVVTGLYEFKKKKKEKWKNYDDRVRNSILLDLLSKNHDLGSDKFNIFIESQEVSPDYSPFISYFKNLEDWDKDKDHIKEVSKTITTDNPKRFQETLERFLVGCIDCIMKVDTVNDVCLVFQGKQGTGKSRWMRKLLPKEFRQEYFYEGEINTKNKDHTMYLSQFWFIHLDELETLRSNDISAIKSYITRQRISVRKAYGRYKSNLIRRASFLGSVNDDKFLSDITGNRRWLVFKTEDIDYQHKLNPNLMWAQAYHLWKEKKYRHWFNGAEIKEINQYNEEFRTVSLEEELILRNFEFNKITEPGEWLGASQVTQKLAEGAPQLASKLHNILTGKALGKHSLSKKMIRGYTKYYVQYVGVQGDINELDQPKENLQTNPINEQADLPF